MVNAASNSVATSERRSVVFTCGLESEIILSGRRKPFKTARSAESHVQLVPISIKTNSHSRGIDWPDLNVQPIPYGRRATVSRKW